MSNHTGGAPEWLTSHYIESMLKTFFKDDHLHVHHFGIEPASSVGDNYLGQLFRLQVKYSTPNGTETRTIIVKSLPETKINEKLEKQVNVLKVESKMLSETLPLLYDELLAKGETERFFPYLYKLDMDHKTIFMEDLKADGYVMVDKVKSLDLDHTLLVIKSLAKMHASSYILLKKDPSHKEHYMNNMYSKSDGEEGFMEKSSKTGVEHNINTLHMWPISEEDKNIFRSFEGRLWDIITDSYEKRESSFNVLLHGDCWTNNMLFKYKNGKVESMKLLDFQLSNYNSFALDMHYFIFLCSQTYVKVDHLEDIFKTYYETFVSVTGKIDGFTMHSVRKEFIERIGFGFLCGIYFRCGMLSDKPYDIDAELEGRYSEVNDAFYTNPEYISEAVKLLPFFKKHKIFK